MLCFCQFGWSCSRFLRIYRRSLCFYSHLQSLTSCCEMKCANVRDVCSPLHMWCYCKHVPLPWRSVWMIPCEQRQVSYYSEKYQLFFNIKVPSDPIKPNSILKTGVLWLSIIITAAPPSLRQFSDSLWSWCTCHSLCNFINWPVSRHGPVLSEGSLSITTSKCVPRVQLDLCSTWV